MKVFFFTLLKILGGTLVLALLVGGFVLYQAINYKTIPLHATKEKFPGLESRADAQRVANELVAQMSLKEKIDQMRGMPRGDMYKFLVNALVIKRFPHVYVGENQRLNLPPWVLSDGPRGSRVMDQKINGVTTFPVAMSRGASWNPQLEYKINEVIASEMRANGTNYAATPCINLLRHPAWGRAQETYGEDPWLLGEFGIAAVKGIESQNVMACPKHFALNSIENSRWVIDVEIDERSLREVYLPHFKRTLQIGKPASIMSAYNSVNGTFCGANKYLLTDILRNEWGFEGFVSTDWFFGLYDGVGGIDAGLNVEMPLGNEYNLKKIKAGIANGSIKEENIDKLVANTLAVRLPYALANDQGQYPKSLIGKDSHTQLALEAAEEGMVLLKNEGLLPFSKEGKKKIAVIGRLADVENTGDHGSSDSKPIYVVTPYQGIKSYQEKLGNEVVLNDGSDLEAAKKLASEADEVILIVGFTFEEEGEFMEFKREKMVESAQLGRSVNKSIMGGDRENLRLSIEDEQLIETLAPTNDQLLVSFVGGSAIDMSAWEDKVPAILFAWYAGMEGGHALANILYGEANPSGKLPFSIAKKDEDYPYFTPYAEKITYGYYHGYTKFDKENIEPAYPFGYGLSYTTFDYSNLQIQTEQLSQTDSLKVSVEVKNTGQMAGKEVVQLYIGFSRSEVDRPVKLLRAFEKLMISPGESRTVHLNVAAQDLARYDEVAKQWVVDPMEYEVFVGGASRGKLLEGAFEVIE